MNPGKPQTSKFSLTNWGGNGNKSFLFKIGLIVGGGIIVMIIIAVLMSFFASNKDNPRTLIGLAQTQQALIVVADDGTRNNRSSSKSNSAMTTLLTLRTQQTEYLAYLATQDIKIKSKELALKQSAETTAQLKQAVESSTYDTVYGQVMEQKLNDYANEIKTTFENVTGPNLRKLLSKDYDQVQLLITQLHAKDTAPDTTPSQ